MFVVIVSADVLCDYRIHEYLLHYAHANGETDMKTIAVVAYEGVEILDTIGPVEVFDLVNRGLREAGSIERAYDIKLLAEAAGPLGPLLAWLDENAHLKVTVEELAERAAMSPRNFARIFVRETGMTPARYIDQIRLQRAIRLLEDTTCPMETVAGESGFASAEQFRRVFRRRMGVTPIDYRERF